MVDPRGVTLPKSNTDQLIKLGLSIKEMRQCFDETFDKEIIKSCSIIFGMHPDEATDAIVEIAGKFSKSFAVVPCCVFPTKFVGRFLKNGEFVVEYEQFVKYIQEIVESSSVFFMNFKGRNKVIFKIKDHI